MMLLASDVRSALAQGPLTASELAERVQAPVERVEALCVVLVDAGELARQSYTSLGTRWVEYRLATTLERQRWKRENFAKHYGNSARYRGTN